ncbi:PaaI family thioesterase [Nocardioides sp.]|uniref:PaaI family thioesterase n=1 Tax=Nocardioides sp. TaxID=35761 RepID=UPI0026259A1E|nr:PaaI family thioesterase [Nocardioides sp.]
MSIVLETADPADAPTLSGLIEEARAMVLAAGTTDVDEAELAAVTAELAALRGRLAAATRPRVIRAPFDSPGAAVAEGRPFRLAAMNPFGIPLEVHFDADGDGAQADFCADARHEGPREHLHGGLSAWLMDCILGIVIQSKGRRAYTANLDVTYRRRTPLDVPLRLGSRITRVEGRKTWMEGWIECDGERTVTATGLFIEALPTPAEVAASPS